MNAAADDVSTLCLACGFCCDGTLFTAVPLGVEESPRLPTTTRANGSRVLLQPCAALNGTCCTMYEARPLACRRYECLLLIALKAGETSLQPALEIVAEAKRRIARLPPANDSQRVSALQQARERHSQGDEITPEFEAAEQYLKFNFAGHRR